MENITLSDYNAHVELFSPLVAEKSSSNAAFANTFPLTKCSGAVEFVPAAIIMADLLTQECDFNGAIPHLLKHLSENPGELNFISKPSF